MIRFCLVGLLACIPATVLGQQEVVDSPLDPTEAARTMIVPDGFEVRLFAGEPDLAQPIGFCIDDRGRLWVAEAYNYPNHTTEPGDRIVIFEDVDNDGQFDKRTVFYDQLNYVTGIEVGFGGVWVMTPPYFLFIPDQDRDDRPDAEPVVLLDGFGTHANAHNLANGLAWGPDGWLYGTHGRTNWSLVGKPLTHEEDRIRFDGGVYRYHPTRHEWESFADGTTNPWGIDWNDYGEAFICNCVNPHLFQVIQGAHYEPWRNRRSSQYAYERIETIADHLHFTGSGNIRDGLGTQAEDDAGGGHAHCGLMVYLGDNWPSRYRNTIFMNNIHGRRINNDLPRRHGSGHIAGHGEDFMRSQDPWFMGVTLAYGFDGSVFVSDWSDTGECHSVRNTRRETGRIYRIRYGEEPQEPVGDLQQSSSRELVEFHLHPNDRFVRHARRILQERQANGESLDWETGRFTEMFRNDIAVPQRLRAFWSLHALDQIDQSLLLEALHDQAPYVRAWAIRFACEKSDPAGEIAGRLMELAASEGTALERLYLASAAQRLTGELRWRLLEQLAAHAEDRGDANLALMYWYALEPLVSEDLSRFVSLGGGSSLPLLQNHVARRAVAGTQRDEGLEAVLSLILEHDDGGRAELLRGLIKGLEGRSRLTAPPAWNQAYGGLVDSPDSQVRQLTYQLAIRFADPVAVEQLRNLLFDEQANDTRRIEALRSLSAATGLLDERLFGLLGDVELQEEVLLALGRLRLANTAEKVLDGLRIDVGRKQAGRAAGVGD